MVLIECFTKAHVDNIAACLRLKPEKLYMLGNAGEMKVPVRRYEKLLQNRGQRTQVFMCDIQGKDIAQICTVLEELIGQAQTCVIDLTGGDGLVIMAVGAVLARLDSWARKRVRVEKFDHASGVVRNCVNDSCESCRERVDLTVDELILLHGGKVYPQTYQPPLDCTYKELEGLWRVVCGEPKQWNRSVTLLNELESRSNSKMQICLPLAHMRGISNLEEKVREVRALVAKLGEEKVVDDQSTGEILEYTYRSQMLRHCTLKAGNALETKTLLEGRAVKDDTQAFFADCRMGVNMDWDGDLYNYEQHLPETRNEIDVVLMHGTTPLFISCKNGGVGDEELYKLHTVASRFGGPYARKMLIVTNLDRRSDAADRAFAQRAWDMDIFLITDAAQMTHEEWEHYLRKAVEPGYM